MFSYADTQLHRLGANARQLPINAPRVQVNNGNQDGALDGGRTVSGVNYQPSRLHPRAEQSDARYSQLPLEGTTQQARIQREQNFKQAGELFRSFSKSERKDLIQSLGASLASADEVSKHIILSFLYKADRTYGEGVASVARGDLVHVKRLASQLSD